MNSGVAGAAFIGHGTPMNAVEQNRYTDVWTEFGTSRQRPKAVLVVSAHWFVQISAVTAMAHPRTIHDFYGFPKELFAVDYPAPGTPALANQVVTIADDVHLDQDSWGLDHGTWSVLTHVFPNADVPVVQLSVHAGQPPQYHFDLGASLAPLLEENIAVIASGNVVHNLRLMDPARDAFDWNRRFDDEARSIMTSDPARAISLEHHADYSLAVPTSDHFLPLMYLAGLAHATGRPADVLVDGFVYGSLSMTSYVLRGDD